MARRFLVLGLLVVTGALAVEAATQNPPAQTPPAQTAPRAGGGGRQGGRGPALPPIDPPKEWLSPKRPKELLEFGMMTWPEVYDAIHHQGKTVALYYAGGTEHRGPQNVNGGHTLMGREIALGIARRLGNAIVLPIIPYSSNNASAQNTGTLGLTPEIEAMITEQIAEQAIATGFTTVVLLNDHGGSVGPNNTVATKLEAKYRAPEFAARNIHVFYADRVYKPAQDDYDKLLAERGLPVSSHAGIPDTSSMMYLGKGKDWVRTDLLKYAVTMGPGYVPVAAGAGRAAGPADPNAPRVVPSGVSGDGRPSNEKYGKEAVEMKIDYAVKQIQATMATFVKK